MVVPLACDIEMTGVDVPLATAIGAVPVTFVTLPVAADTQLKIPAPLVASTWPDEPLLDGNSKVIDDAKVSGAFSATELTEPLSLSTSLFAVVLLPRIVTLPWELTLAAVSAPVAAVPVVLIVVDPPILDAPSIVAELKILLVSVSVAPSVTITPEFGKVAVEFTPVPPFALGKIPVTAAD